jgi:hypothetical protein
MRFRGRWILAVVMGSLVLCVAYWLFARTLVAAENGTTPLNVCSDTRAVQIILTRPFFHENGLMYLAKVRIDTWRIPNYFKWKLLSNLSLGPSDTLEEPTRATSVVCEDDKQLGPAHSLHVDIVRLGHGRYSQWEGGLLFSSSDGTNPNENGHAYKAIEP